LFLVCDPYYYNTITIESIAHNAPSFFILVSSHKSIKYSGLSMHYLKNKIK